MVILVHSLVCLLVCFSTRLYSAAPSPKLAVAGFPQSDYNNMFRFGWLSVPTVGASSKETPGQTPADSLLPLLRRLTHLHFSLSI